MATNRATRYPGRWGAVSADYPMGVPKNRTSDTAKDGSYFEKDWIADYEAYFGAVLDEAGETVNGTTDTAQSSQLHKAMQKAREVSPLNNDWNGYLDPDHQSSLPAPNGYPGAPGSGEVSYTADQEISSGIFAGSGGATVSSDSDGWIFTGSIYKLYDYTTEQLADIDVTKVPVYLKDQAGAEYFLKHNGSSVIVTKVGGQLKVEITAAIFTVSFTKLWRFFVAERVGRVVELSANEAERRIRGGYTILQTAPNVESEFYTDGKVIVRGSATLNQQVVTNVDIGIDTTGLTVLSSSVTAQDSTGVSSYRTSLANSPSLSGSNIQIVSTWPGNNIPVKFEVVLR